MSLKLISARSIAATHAAVFGLCAVGVVALAAPATAQGLIRDTEIENLLNDYARPVFKAAGLGTGRIKVRIVSDDGFNAFVLDGRNVFIHTGTLMQAQTPNEVIGVLAHETGHITGGHIAALKRRIKQDSYKCTIFQLLGIGAMVAGGLSGGSTRDMGAAGQGIMAGGCEVIMRGLLLERRQQELAADQAGLHLLNATKQSGIGMLDTFERLAEQERYSGADLVAYARTHPLSAERVTRLRKGAESSRYYAAKDPPTLQLRHDLMRAKLAGYIERPQLIWNRYPRSDNSLPARYARAIARYFQGGAGALDAAVAEINSLIRERPDNPYFVELKGDLLMRAGRPKQAVAPLQKALKMLPGSDLIRVQLATALLKQNDPSNVAGAIKLLRESLTRDKNAGAYTQLAAAYYRLGKQPEAEAMMAQAHFVRGDIKQAQIFAKRAHARLKHGSPEWFNNDDIINYKPQT